ncbi:hypothetical protein QCM77_12595 [Bradyrhizobium sp. SSUT18]|uniref:hypothetical protein n=1 Tax=Bradyrhizobium sp. SSUT18 TaxID=3040602 RepID=UPI002448D8B3|nr:hypothetical protein [Bradyrhizobium sp. SSUT18]MDH2400774.1 hypothetical protein [Bradyrhizobium sp. SSUT18]
MIGRLGNVLYWSGLAIASLCEIAAILVSLIIIMRRIDPEAWFAVAFFAGFGGCAWLAGRAAKYILTGV